MTTSPRTRLVHDAPVGDPSPTGSTAKGLLLLQALAQAGASVRLADLALGCGMSKPTAHRVLVVLRDLGWVRTHEGGHYSLGPQAHAFAAMAAPATSVEQSLTVLRDAVGRTVHSGVLLGDHVVYTHKLDGHDQFVMRSRLGATASLHSTAMGKALLAHLPDDRVAEVLAAELPRRTDHTLVEPAALRAELRRIRERGYAVDDEENEQNIRCVATVVPEGAGHPVRAVSISTVTFLTDREELMGYVPALRQCAESLVSA
ncbi:IclR family transcriptional regulator [Kineococcus arenarius]|uniref:IclR family transcriptional regulator n=1 Tax=unclassified Kineococcus TaxID=2621656 RepID=UPI003D7E9C6A